MVKLLRTILLVEDEVLIALNTRMTLENHGYKVIIAQTGEKAIGFFDARTDIDLVLMDIDLGHGIDGPGTARRILEKGRLPILFLSSHVEQDIVERTEDIPSYGYVVKYTGETVLLTSIKTAWRLFQETRNDPQADAALKDREERYRTLIAGLPDTVARFDRSGRHLFLSENVKKIIGADASEFLDRSYRELGFSDTACRFIEEGIERAFSAGGSSESEIPLDTPNGLLVFNWRLLPEFDERGEVKSVLSIGRDITDKRHAEEKLRKYEELLSAVYTSSDLSIFVISVTENGKYICEGINPKLEILLGMPAEVVAGKTPDDMREAIGEGPVRFLYSIFDECVRMKNSLSAEYEVVSGPVRGWWYLRLSPILNPATGRVEKLIGSGINITDRKNAEAEISKERHRYESLIESTHAGTWEWDVQTGEFRINERLASMFDYKYTEYETFTAEKLVPLIHPDDYVTTYGTVTEYLSGDKPFFDCEFRIRRKNQHWIWIQTRGKVITRTAEGNPHMVFGTLTDISERKRNEETIRNLLAEKEVLLKEVHHRVKNNMITIEKLLSMQAKSTRAATPKDAMLQAGGYVAGMRLLYEKMLQSENYRNVSIRRYFTELLDFIRTAFADSRSITFRTTIDDFDISARELFPLSLILNELITNIMKYAFTGREDGTISVTVGKTGDDVRLVVEDDGVGLQDDFSVERFGGFGLSLVHMMSAQLRGRFSMENREPEGGVRSVIDFTLESVPSETTVRP